MRYAAILLPAVLLTGCSFLGMGQNAHHSGSQYGQSHHSQGQYGQSQYGHQGHAAQQAPGCSYMNCTSGYSVPHSGDAAYHGGQHGQQAYGQQGYAQQGYGAPQTPSAHAYGGQTAHYGAPALRGAYGQARRAYKYGTLGGTMYDFDGDIYGIQGRLGYQSASVLGAEVEGSFGVSDESTTVGATTGKLGVDYQLAGFAVARAPLGNKFSVHSRAGYHVTQFGGEETTAGVTTDIDIDSQDGFAYGIGGEYALGPNKAIRLDVTRYNVDGGGLESLALGYSQKF